MQITNERIDSAIDLLIAMTVDSISKEKRRNASDVLSEFLSSHTASMLYDRKNKLWWDGPAYIEEVYEKELSKK